METMNIDLGLFTETTLIKGLHTSGGFGCEVSATEAKNIHQGGDLLPRIDRREVIWQDEDGEWICPKGEEVLRRAGVLMIEEYVHSEEARDDHEIHKMRNIHIWEVQKLPKER
jgi:hypothetical protein